MAQSYYGAGAGQSGSVQSVGGAIAGFDKGNDDDYETTYYSDLLNNKARKYARLLKPADVTSAYNEFNTLYRGNDALAKENADFYAGQAKGILSDNTKTADTYERLRSGNLSSLADSFKNVLDYGLASQKARLAAGGYGGSGPSAYDRILNSTVTASNIAPVLNTIYGNLGRDATAAIGGDRAWDAYRMGQFAQDPLTAYADGVAGRALVPIQQYRGLINNDIGTMSNLLNNVVIPNVSGVEMIPGLSSRLNNFAAGTMNLSRFGGELVGTYGGAMTGGGIQGMMQQQQGGQGGQQSMPSQQGFAPQGMNINPQMLQQAMQMYQQFGGGMGNSPYTSSYGGGQPALNSVPATGGYNYGVSY